MRIINGDISRIDLGVVIHQVNCQNRIGAGVSGAIINKWPKVETAYHNACMNRAPQDLLGMAQFITIREPGPAGCDGLRIVNSFTQLNYGNAAKTGKVYTNMRLLIKNLLRICYQNPKETVYIPYGIGCGLAGGNWNELTKWISDVPNLVAVRKK